MTPKAKPYSLGWTISVGLATALAFMLLSLFFLYMQVEATHHRLAGEVVAVSDESISVQNAHGDVTVLFIPDDAELRGMVSLEELEVGQHVMTRGRFADDGSFQAERIRTLTERPAK